MTKTSPWLFVLMSLLIFQSAHSQSNVGVGTNSPVTKMDVNGAIALREGTAIALSNGGASGGTNDNIALPVILGTSDVASFYRIIGPTGAFSIYGIKPSTGADGEVVTLINVTGKVMTIINNNSGTAANGIVTQTGANLVDNASSTANSSITMQYNKSVNRWYVTATQNYIINTASLVTNSVVAGASSNALSVTNGSNQVVGASNLTLNVAKNAVGQDGVVPGTVSPANNNQVWGTNGSGVPAWGSVSNAQLANSAITVTNGGSIGISGSPVSLGGIVTLTNNGVTALSSASPLTSNVSATGAVTVNLTGIVPIANGGTNNNAAGLGTANNFLVYNGTGITASSSNASSFAPASGGNYLAKNSADVSAVSVATGGGNLYQFTQSNTTAATANRSVVDLVDNVTTPGAFDYLLRADNGGTNKFSVATNGNATIAGTETVTGLVTQNGGLTESGTANINTTGSAATNIGTTSNTGAVSIGNAAGGVSVKPLTTAGVVLTSSSGLLSSVATLPNSNLANSSITVSNGGGIGVSGSPVSLGGTVTITNNGVTSLTSTSPLTANTSATGAVTVNLTGIVPVANGGTGDGTLTTGGVLYGNGTGAVQVTPAPTSGQILVGNTVTPAFVSMSGDATITNAGVVTVTGGGSGNGYIKNQTTAQSSSNFNISGAGVVGTTMTAATYQFPPPTGDGTPVITTRTVPSGQGSSNERTELILFHSNDGTNGAGPDLITLRAPAVRLQTYDDATVGDINNASGSNDRLYIAPGGNVGIGTSSSSTPAGNLQVMGTYVCCTSGSSSVNYDISNRLYLTNNSSDYGRTNLVLTGRIQGGNDGWSFGTGARNSIVFAENAATTGASIGSTGTEQYSIQVEGNSNSLGFLSKTNGSTPVMTMLQNGNVGLGTTSAATRLEVAAPSSGTIAAGLLHLTGGQAWGNVLTVATDNTGGSDNPRINFSYRAKAKQWQIGGYNADTRFSIWEDGGDGTYGTGWGTERVTVLAGGNVGIGTSAPGNLLDVQGGNIDASGYIMAGGTGGGAVMFSGATAVNGGALAAGMSFYGRPRIGDWGNWLTLGEPNNTNGGMVLQIQGTAIVTGTSTGLGVAFTPRITLDDGSGNFKVANGTTPIQFQKGSCSSDNCTISSWGGTTYPVANWLPAVVGFNAGSASGISLYYPFAATWSNVGGNWGVTLDYNGTGDGSNTKTVQVMFIRREIASIPSGSSFP